MPADVWVALIGAAGTVLAAVIGVYPGFRGENTDGAPDKRGGALKRRAVVVIAGAAVAGGLFVALTNVFLSSHRDRVKLRVATGPIDSLILRGIRARKPYVMPTVTMLVRLDSAYIGSDPRLQATIRTVYEVLPLSDHQEDDRDFVESYHSMAAGRIDYIPGSDRESVTEGTTGLQSWIVSFSTPAGAPHSIVTGAREIYPNKPPLNHEGHYFQLLGEHEDEYCYPNDAADVIGQLVLVVESPMLRLTLDSHQQSAGVITASGARMPVDAAVHEAELGSRPYRAVVARFNNLPAGARACLKAQW